MSITFNINITLINNAIEEANMLADSSYQGLALESAFLSWMQCQDNEKDALIKVFGSASAAINALANLRGMRWEHIFDSFDPSVRIDDTLEKQRAQTLMDMIAVKDEDLKAELIKFFGSKDKYIRAMLGEEDAAWLKDYLDANGMPEPLSKFHPLEKDSERTDAFEYATMHGDREIKSTNSYDGMEEHDPRDRGYTIPILWDENGNPVIRNGHRVFNVMVVFGTEKATSIGASLVQDVFDRYFASIKTASPEERKMHIIRKEVFKKAFEEFRATMSCMGMGTRNKHQIREIKIGWKNYFACTIYVGKKNFPITFFTPQSWKDLSPKAKSIIEQRKEEWKMKNDIRNSQLGDVDVEF